MCDIVAVKTETSEVQAQVRPTADTLDELQDPLMAQNPKLIAELRAARREDRTGLFKLWKPRCLQEP